MIVTKRNYMGYINEITDYLDRYLTLDKKWNSTYIYKTPMGKNWLIRVPGATRGNFRVEDNKIVSIDLYKDTCFDTLQCYDKAVLENLDQFIGKEIIFEKEGV